MTLTAQQRDALGQTVDRNFASQIALLDQLVSQSSCSRELDDVDRAMAILDEAMSGLGFRTEVVKARPTAADHRLYTLGSGTNAIGLVGHVDTVFPRSLGFSGFHEDGDVLRGPGVLDMKSGLTSIVFAVKALAEATPNILSELSIRFIVVSDEEVGSGTSRGLYKELSKDLRGAMVFEAGRDQDLIVTRRRGGGVLEFHVEGKAAHAGNRHREGVSAIEGAARLTLLLEALTDYERGLLLNVGLFNGGTAKNTVPDTATLGVDFRYESMPDGHALMAQLHEWVNSPAQILKERSERLAALNFSMSGGITRPPMERLAGVDWLLEQYIAEAKTAGLGGGEAGLQGGGSDGNLLTGFGVPTIDGLGPYGQYFHETREWCSRSSLLKRTTALATFLGQSVSG